MVLPDARQGISGAIREISQRTILHQKRNQVVWVSTFLQQCFVLTDISVLLLDEMDKLINERKQGVLYQIFDWATSKARRLVVIGIANTMNLEER